MNGDPNHRGYVWINTDSVDAILRNNGTLPKGWKPTKKKRGRDSSSSSWGWTRAIIVSSSSTAIEETPEHNGRSFRRPRAQNSVLRLGNNDNSKIQVTLTVHDSEFSPAHLKGKTVSLCYNRDDTQLICDANAWWNNSSDHNPPEDLTSLTHLHEPSVVYCLKRHYQQNSIYIYTGKILLALNPFQILDDTYGESIMERYWKNDTKLDSIKRPPPHVYAIAQDAYQSLLNEGDDQSILVSGESGSGKTVTTKYIMGYLAKQSQRNTLLDLTKNNDGNRNGGIESQILQSNPILESFGNARTIRNDNSSRFGKFIALLFSPGTGQLTSASIKTYLLEKVRLISQAPGERNYHIFYELLAGLSQEERDRFKVGNFTAKDFQLTGCSGTFDRRDGVADKESFLTLRNALRLVGFSEIQDRNLFAVICALLHTSNITFKSASVEGSELNNSRFLTNALLLLGVSQEALNKALCVCVIRARDEYFEKQLSIIQARKALEALIKATYGALFTHIVGFINQSIAASLSITSHATDFPRIGVLDIFGFESFEVNSYEQLCINYCNEALQQQFNQFVFKLEQQEYEQEGIDWSFIEFPDNQDILDLIENKRGGILSILDENCRLASCTDATFCRALYNKCGAHSRFNATQAQKASFVFSIDHYAGVVAYNSANFLEKNKNELPEGTTKLLVSSSLKFISHLGEILTKDKTQTTESPSSENNTSGTNIKRERNNSSILRTTVGNQFSQQLRELRDTIDSTKPHYVRCLKPTDALVPNRFEPLVISEQLRCAGVLEAIRVSRVGFPHRYYREEFVVRYGILTTKLVRPRRGRDICSSLITALIPQVSAILKKQDNLNDAVTSGMQVGYSKVFLRTSVFDALEFLRIRKIDDSSIKIQKNARRIIAQRKYSSYLIAIVRIQCFVRQIDAYLQAKVIKEYAAATKIQSVWRRFFAETELMASRLIAHFCQVYWRGSLARKLYAIMTLESQAKVIQRYWRCYRAKFRYLNALNSVISIQCFWRCKIARISYKELRQHALNIDIISAERDRFKEESVYLRKEVESLKMSNQNNDGYQEVDILRKEIKRLQSMLSITEGSQTTDSSFNNGCSEPFLASKQNSVLPTSIPSTYISSFTRDESKLTGPSNFINIQAKEDSMSSSMYSIGFSPGVSSPNSSLLDADPQLDIANSQLKGNSDSFSCHSRISNISMIFDDNDCDKRQQHKHNHDEMTMFHNSIRNGNVCLMNELIKKSKDFVLLVNSPNLDGQSALHIAVQSDNVGAIQDLLEKSAVANAQDTDGNTPLHLCTAKESIRLLLEVGSANPNIPNMDGICVLHRTVERLDVASIRLLLNHFAKIDVADNINWFTPLHMALLPFNKIEKFGSKMSEVSRPIIVDLLCGELSKVEINEQDRDGNTPLHLAVQLDTIDATAIIRTLLDKGADPTIQNTRNQQPLLLLCHNNNLRQYDTFQESVHTMLHYGADPNHQSNTGCTPLHLSIYHNDIDSALQLINRSAELHLTWKRVSFLHAICAKDFYLFKNTDINIIFFSQYLGSHTAIKLEEQTYLRWTWFQKKLRYTVYLLRSIDNLYLHPTVLGVCNANRLYTTPSKFFTANIAEGTFVRYVLIARYYLTFSRNFSMSMILQWFALFATISWCPEGKN